jgi:TRAP-type C4-dicarboxylate transport system permease small subunit
LIHKFNKLLDYILHWATALTAMLFFLIVLASVIVRAIPKVSFHSAIELSRLLFVWSCFLAAALAYRQRAHVAFTLLSDRVAQHARHYLGLVIEALVFVFSAVILYESVLTCRMLWPSVLPILGISQGWFYVPVPVLCVFILCYSAEFMAEQFKRGTME